MLALSVIVSLLALASAVPTLDASGIVVRGLNETEVEEDVIPVRDIGCWKDKLPEDEVEIAKEKLIQWGANHQVGRGSWHGEQFDPTGFSILERKAAMWLCNCKHFKKDYAVSEELNEAQDLIYELCGLNSTGWVWTKKWQKSFNIGTAKKMNVHGYDTDRCPRLCLWNQDQREDDPDYDDGKPGVHDLQE
ncbi:hypothetical protein O1611_g9357 [Lasiodiplodia mahajangana]|uniref:Uncharacterized protein n=1 Tax=Lasiodiplodia mahajangana TaxID=1108764 RepID=A0ACC2JA93_9PEZI|nr:hypothetical protein O1611_g9357 [Lasiodiplodia mahajangana]